MKKHIICTILIMVMVFAVLPVGVSASINTAGEVYNEEFTHTESETEGWVPDGWLFEKMNGTSSLEGTASISVTDEGYIQLDRGDYDGVVRVTYNGLPSIPSEFTYTIDVMATADATSAWITANFNGYYIAVTSGGAVEYMTESGSNTYKNFGSVGDTWYTYCFQVKGDSMNVYRKERGENNQYLCLLENVKMQVRSGHRLYTYLMSPGKLGVDNIKITEGIFPVKTEIRFGDGEGTNKKISGTMTVSARTVSPTEPMNVMALMTIHDQRGKTVDIVTSAVPLEYDENTIALEKEYTAEKFEKMQGGTAKIYLWESFEDLEPLTKAYSVTIQ